jgi:dTMP kinase
VLEAWVQDGLQPDLTLLFDVPLETASARLAGAREPDKFEAESRAFFDRTRREYLRRAAESPQRFRVIDATRTIAEIQVELEKIMATL